MMPSNNYGEINCPEGHGGREMNDKNGSFRSGATREAMQRAFSLAATVTFLIFGGVEPAKADTETYGALYLHSWHLGTTELNDVTPGLSFGRRWARDTSSLEFHAEAGVFYNSYEEISPLALFGLSWAVAAWGPGDLRLGSSVGAARYVEQSKRLKASHGIPNANGFLPIIAGTLSYRWDETDIRITTVPPGEGVDAIFNLSIARTF
jgi:hypothetical protein